jgi:hypothetical protein
MNYPPMHRVRQVFDTTSIPEVAAVIREEFSKLNLAEKVRPGQRVAVTAGSRGIDNYVTMLASVVECLRALELKPLIIPAMGSHGGATAEGQATLLEELGINQATVGAPIHSNMEVVSVGHLESGAEVFISKEVMEADHLVVLNRVKPHTAFHGEVESGLCKMLAVGCGKHRGALKMHTFGLSASIVPAAQLILKKISVLFGLAIVENSLDKTHTLRFALPEQFPEVDKELLEVARRLLPRIPLDHLDILVVDEMGKEISGTGIDPNVVGFWRREGGPRKPDYKTLIVLNLTPHSRGNALGIGMVDLTTRRLLDHVDLNATYANALTTGIWSSVRFPMALENDRAVLETALSHVPDLSHIRMVRIVNTLRLEIFWATEALLPELRDQRNCVVEDAAVRLEFDEEERLLPFRK